MQYKVTKKETGNTPKNIVTKWLTKRANNDNIKASPDGRQERKWKRMAKNMTLRGIIYSRYDSEADFARSLGWTRQKLNRIVNGKMPNIEELNAIAQGLNVPVSEAIAFFLPV